MCGLNLGNLAFANMGHQLFEGDKIPFEGNSTPEEIRKNADVVVFAVANWLNATNDLGWLADRVEAIDRPVILMGIGAQNGLGAPELVLPEGTKRFLQACASRTPNILVRGPYTASICNSVGVSNVIPLGCPSLLTERKPDLGRFVASRWQHAAERLAFHALEIQPWLASTEQHLLKLARENEGSAIVVQHQHEMIDLVMSEGRNLRDDDTARLRWICKFLDPTTPIEETWNWLRQHLFFFDSVDAWRRFLRNYSGSINTRIHGTLLSLSAGIPSVCLHHDSRTKELAETMHIPTLLQSRVTEERMTARDIMEAAPIDAEAFDGNRKKTAQVYLETLSAIGLQPSQHLMALASGN